MERILVGVDYRESSDSLTLPTQRAIDKAIWLGARENAEVTMLCVLPVEASETTDQLESSEQADLQSRVREILQPQLDAAKQKGVAATLKFAYGRAWYELICEVLRSDISVVIVGTREKSMAERMLYGSTAVKLVRKCPCPVWVTRPDVDPESASTIVAAVDFSPVCDQILHMAVRCAQMIQARLLVVHAVSYPLEGSMIRTECSQEDLDTYKENVRKNAEAELIERLSATDYRTLQSGTQLIVQGGPAETVIDQAVTDHSADMLVMGTIGRAGLPGFFFGNVAERLMPTLRCSLLAIKPDGYVSPVKLP